MSHLHHGTFHKYFTYIQGGEPSIVHVDTGKKMREIIIG